MELLKATHRSLVLYKTYQNGIFEYPGLFLDYGNPAEGSETFNHHEGNR